MQTTPLFWNPRSRSQKSRHSYSRKGQPPINKRTQHKKTATRKIYVNKIHVKLGHTGEDRMHTTEKKLHYSVKGTLEVFEDCAKAKIRNKFLRKVAEERDLKPG